MRSARQGASLKSGSAAWSMHADGTAAMISEGDISAASSRLILRHRRLLTSCQIRVIRHRPSLGASLP